MRLRVFRVLTVRRWRFGATPVLGALALLAVAVVSALPALFPAIAGASKTWPGRTRPAQVARAELGRGSGRQLGLSQAPPGLRTAVRRTLGVPDSAQSSLSQQAKLTFKSGASGDQFGYSVAVYGSTAVVGAPGRNSGTGATYVFVRSGSTWSRQAELHASDAHSRDEFGYSVAIYGYTAVVGAPGKNSNTGAAYEFVRSGTAWSQEVKRTAPDGAAGDEFGYSVALWAADSESWTVVGAPGKNANTGVVYVFTAYAPGCPCTTNLTASDAAANDRFGSSVALSGVTAVIGAPGKNSNSGAAYMFGGYGSTWSQQAELTASDAAANDHFGSSVAVSGSTAVVGAPGKNSNTGAAYVFYPSGSTWSQQAELTASDGAANDHFGVSVAVVGSTAVVGASSKSSSTGAGYVFVRSGTAWAQQAKLVASDAATNDQFGRAVAISGSTPVVGAPGENSSTGAAYVFALPFQPELTAPNGSFGDEFGYSVAISGSTAVVGDYGNNSAYVFVRSGSTWSTRAKLTASGAGQFGWSVAIYGVTLVVGAPATNGYTGAAYVFVRSGSTWSQQAELTASDAAPDVSFGYSVAIYGSTAIVGEPSIERGLAGAAYVFDQSGTTWSQQAELTPSDSSYGDEFGCSVAIDGSIAVVGTGCDVAGAVGAAYVFVRPGSTWSQQAKLTAPDGAAGDSFGYSVAIYGSTAVIGAPGKNSNTGAAYVFVRSGSTWSQQAELTASDAAVNDEFGYSVALYGSTAVVGAPVVDGGVPGAAYAFVRSGTAWSQQAELTPPDAAPGNWLGWSVAINQSTAIAGAIGDDSFTGAAYVFAGV
jgi:hypothetical protein